MYSVKQFADLFGTTEHTVRYYTDIDLLPCEQGSGNRRVFNMDEKVKHYEQILAGRIPDDINPESWTRDTRPEKCEEREL